MKLRDKLPKLRKAQNLSQEQKLNVSRQAVAKWEAGASYPEMEKIMQLCRVLDCSLDDLVDDDATGNKSAANNKSNLNLYLKECLDFITNSINMFWSMRWREKIQCIFEMTFYLIVLMIAWAVIRWALYSIGIPLTGILPNIANRIIHAGFNFILAILQVATVAIVLIHLFKIRYLDYFVTVEDVQAKSKTKEVPVEEIENKKTNKEQRVFIEQKRNKIIIRDAKHSSYNFFYLLAKLIILIVKIGLVFVAVPFICSFLFFAFADTFAASALSCGNFFLGLVLAITGAGIINYLILLMMYNFVFNQKSNFKIIFVLAMIGLIFVGAGAAVSFDQYTNFNKIESEAQTIVRNLEIDMSDDLALTFLDDEKIKIAIDNSQENIQVQLITKESLTAGTDYYAEIDYDAITFNEDELEETKFRLGDLRYGLYYGDSIERMQSWWQDLKNQQIRADGYQEVTEILVTTSATNLAKLNSNYQHYLSLESGNE
ncbi:MAG: helix-turn-helix transcriptional regulator [bacterium]|nr:helix-turn-helix transcriptional regulator [bacterium]